MDYRRILPVENSWFALKVYCGCGICCCPTVLPCSKSLASWLNGKNVGLRVSKSTALFVDLYQGVLTMSINTSWPRCLFHFSVNMDNSSNSLQIDGALA